MNLFKTTFVALAMIAAANNATAQNKPILSTTQVNLLSGPGCKLTLCISYSYACTPSGPCSVNNASILVCTDFLPPATSANVQFYKAPVADPGCTCSLVVTGITLTKTDNLNGTEVLSVSPSDYDEFQEILEGGSGSVFMGSFLKDCDGNTLSTPSIVTFNKTFNGIANFSFD